MAYAKAVISVDREVFIEAEVAAAELHISRGELYTRALRLFLRQRKTLRLQEDIARAAAYLAEFSTNQDDDLDSLHNVASETMRRAIERGESTW